MSKPYIILSSWPSFCEKLLKLVEIWRSYGKKTILTVFLDTVYKSLVSSGVFRGRATVRCPPLAGPWKFFTGDFIWKGAFFAIFQQELQNSTMFDDLLRFQISFKHSEAKSVSASGGLRPLTPRPGALLRALAMAPLCQILNTPLLVSDRR